jgi:hypothetical protein
MYDEQTQFCASGFGFFAPKFSFFGNQTISPFSWWETYPLGWI